MEAPDPRRIFEYATANWLSRAVAVAVKRNLFEPAEDGLTALQVQQILRCNDRPARMMTDVLCGARLLERRDDRVFAAPLARAYLVPGRDNWLGDLLVMLDTRLYKAWARLEEALELEHPVVDTYREGPPDLDEANRLAREAINGLHGMTLMAGKALARAVDLSTCRRVMDLGGGSGAMSIALTTAWPELEVVAVDHGPIIDVIVDNTRAAGVGDRVRTHRANFFTDPLPDGFDAVILSNILHDWSREQGLLLLGRAHEALVPGGRVIVNEWLIDDDRCGPLLSALLSLCMLIETQAGENLTGQEIANLMAQRGFTQMECRPTLFPHGAVIGHKI